MIALQTVAPDSPSDIPPFVLIHGAANSAAVWTFWQQALADRGVTSYALDLRGHGDAAVADLSRTCMRDYADDLRECRARNAGPAGARRLEHGRTRRDYGRGRWRRRSVRGACAEHPRRARRRRHAVRAGEFGAEEYGITSVDPDDQPAMPDLDREERQIALASLCRESRYARDERAAGVVVESLPCPLLIVTSTGDTQWPRSRYDELHLPAEHMSVDGASHWGLVLNRRVLATLVPDVLRWTSHVALAPPPPERPTA